MAHRSAASIAQEVYSTGTELRNSIEEFAGKRIEGASYDTLKKIDSSLTEEKLAEINKKRIIERLTKHNEKLDELREALKREGIIH